MATLRPIIKIIHFTHITDTASLAENYQPLQQQLRPVVYKSMQSQSMLYKVYQIIAE